MAVWTYHAILVPKKEFIDNPKINHKTIINKKFWVNVDFGFDIEKYLDNTFNRLEHWCDRIKSWGECENKINLMYIHPLYIKKNTVREIRMELDLRYLSMNVLNKFIDLAVKLDCYIIDDLYSHYHIVEPTLEEMMKDIKTSLAFEFISDPDGYLDNIDRFNKK